MRLLLVEDESDVATVIREGLLSDAYEVDAVADGAQALERVSKGTYDLILLDVGLPTLSGIEVCRRLREQGHHVPVLMLTARDTVRDKVQGLEAGADDYLTKPFALDELKARVRALLRRHADSSLEPQVHVADLTLDTATHEVRRAGRAIELTPKEFALLEFLMRRPERVLTRAVIQEQVWNTRHATSTNVVDVYIRRLRRKIDQGYDRPLIRTLRGLGYQLKP